MITPPPINIIDFRAVSVVLTITLSSLLSCKQTVSDEIKSQNIYVDTLQFESYTEDYDYPMAYFINSKGDTLLFLADSAIDASARMKVFEVQYKTDSVEEAGEGTMVMKLRLLKMRLLESHPSLVESRSANEKALFDLTGQWPEFYVQTDIEEDEMLVGINKESEQRYRFVSFKKSKGAWKKSKEFIYEAEQIEFIDEFQYGLNTNNLHYIYFSTIERQNGTANASSATVAIGLYDFFDLQVIRCEGSARMGGTMVGECDFARALQQVDDEGSNVAKAFFEKQIRECTVLYNDKGFNDIESYVERWESENTQLQEFYQNNEKYEGEIKFTFYKESPISMDITHKVIENTKWIVYSFFRSSVIAFDKESSKYMVVYAERCDHHCDKSIGFDEASEDILIISWDEDFKEGDEEPLKLNVFLNNGSYTFSQASD